MQGGVDPGDRRFRRRLGGVVDVEGFIIRAGDVILPALRRLHEPKPVYDR